MDYIIATHNMKKRDELQRILSPLGIRVLLAEEAGIELSDVEETGTTFEENAFLKAESGCRESGMPCLADDSGIAVDYLGGAPGVYSARYAGEPCDDDANNAKLFKALEGVPDAERGAAYVSVVCCVYPDGRKLTARGEHCVSCCHKHNITVTSKLNNVFVRLFTTYKHDAMHIHHLCRSDDLRVDKARQKHALILNVSKHVAHHIAAAG